MLDLTLSAYMVVPFRLTEVQARVVARSWVKKSLPKELPPLIHSGTPVEGNRHTVGYPAEYENADNWLKGSSLSLSLVRDWN